MAVKKQWDLCSPHQYESYGEKKTKWHKVGVMWLNDKGTITIELDSYPVPNEEHRVRMVAFEPKPREDAPAAAAPQKPIKEDLNDEVPF